tara:strand:- start:1527 stop:2780 length:1254 start_codon:yes stop_codon:yes gene_type:complete
MFALIDCNNFYVSCERVFNPKLIDRPVVVLSNNDGCIISRSDEVKQLGIPMGAPVFKYRSILDKNNVEILSSNYPLYADMSYRVMSILNKFVLDIEFYSIDEAFFSFHGFEHYDTYNYALKIRQTILKWTGIPTSIGIAPTKTLSKIANKIARKYPIETNDVYIINDEFKRIQCLKKFSLKDIWGIGRRLSLRLEKTGCTSAYDFTQLPSAWIKSNLSIVEFRLQQELKGVPSLRLDAIKNKKSISTTRTFENTSLDIEYIKERVSTFSVSCAEKLRQQGLVCSIMIIFLRSNVFRKDLKQHSVNKIVPLPYSTNSSLVLNSYAVNAVSEIFKKGVKYRKAGVIVYGLYEINNTQLSIFNQENPRHADLMSVIDKINFKYVDKIKLANQDLKIKWKMKQNFVSPQYTTKFDDIIKVL